MTIVTFFRRALWPLSLLFWGLSQLRRWHLLSFKKPTRLSAPTISIGNISMGGTGKSPLVMSLCRHLVNAGHHPAIVTRGYRSGLGDNESMALQHDRVIMPPPFSKNARPDEAIMEAMALPDVPVIIGARRLAAVRRYESEYPKPSHWILEDGLQHLTIARDLDLVCLDAACPYSDGWLLPAGGLRELPSRLATVQGLLFTRYEREHDARIAAVLREYPLPHLKVPFVMGQPRHRSGPHVFTLSGQRVRLLTAIAHPAPLIDFVKAGTWTVTDIIALRDHEPFSDHHLQGSIILTTEKDYWRDPELFRRWSGSVYIIPLEAEISDDSWANFLAAAQNHAKQKKGAAPNTAQ